MAIQERFGDVTAKDVPSNSTTSIGGGVVKADVSGSKGRSKSPRNSHGKNECDVHGSSSQNSAASGGGGVFNNKLTDAQTATSATRRDVGFHPSKLTFRFLETGYRPRTHRRLSMSSLKSSDKPIMNSTVLELMDFVDLFKAFSLRCRKDLKDLFEQLAVTQPARAVTLPEDMMHSLNQHAGTCVTSSRA